jgi:hypothetical protein
MCFKLGNIRDIKEKLFKVWHRDKKRPSEHNKRTGWREFEVPAEHREKWRALYDTSTP